MTKDYIIKLPADLINNPFCNSTMTVPIIVIERLSKKIVWLNKSAFVLAGEPSINFYGQHVSALLQPRDGFSASSFLKSIEDSETIAAYLVSNITTSNITGIRVIFNGVLQDGYYFLFLKIVDSPMHRDMLSTNKDFMIICDAKQRILEITPNGYLAPILQKTSLHMRSISALLNAYDIETISKQRSAARQYISEYAKQDMHEWSTSFHDSFTSLSNWIKDENGQHWQRSHDKGYAYTGKNDISYLYLSKSLDLAKSDISIKCKIKQQKPSRFALIFNQQEPSKWDPSGYSIGINPVENGFTILLKKDTRFVVYSKIETTFGLTILFHVEKIGGRIRLYINEEQFLEYYDESIINNKNNAFGILSGCDNTILDYEILTSNSNFNYTNTIQKPFRLSLKLVPGRIYDMTYVSLTEWPMHSKTPDIVEAMLFRDATEIANIEEDRAKLYEINKVLKSKNYYGFIGGNTSILKTIEIIESMADFSASVLIDGPTGSGKEVLARAIHMRSNRRDKPFVKIDCTSLPQTLLESELFGHEKGAFTGAFATFKGRFELAEGGTLFLDEIGNIDKSIQAKLLGFLEDRTITPLGSNRSIKIDTRVIVATNASLETMIKKGEFREDLFFRLKVIHLHLPPLRERLDDIPILVDSFITQINERNSTNVKGIETFVLEALLSYSWPGNVRELYNTLLTMVIQKKEGLINERPNFSYTMNSVTMSAIPERVRHERIIEYAKTKNYLTIRECTAIIPVSIHTLRKDFLKLTSQNKLVAEGKGPGILYRINS